MPVRWVFSQCQNCINTTTKKSELLFISLLISKLKHYASSFSFKDICITKTDALTRKASVNRRIYCIEVALLIFTPRSYLTYSGSDKRSTEQIKDTKLFSSYIISIGIFPTLLSICILNRKFFLKQ